MARRDGRTQSTVALGASSIAPALDTRIRSSRGQSSASIRPSAAEEPNCERPGREQRRQQQLRAGATLVRLCGHSLVTRVSNFLLALCTQVLHPAVAKRDRHTAVIGAMAATVGIVGMSTHKFKWRRRDALAATYNAQMLGQQPCAAAVALLQHNSAWPLAVDGGRMAAHTGTSAANCGAARLACA